MSVRVAISGERNWTALAVVDEGVFAPVISAALFGRCESRARPTTPIGVSAMRKQFGGHDEKKKGR